MLDANSSDQSPPTDPSSAAATPAAPADRPPIVLAEPRELPEGESASSPVGLVVLAGLMGLLWFGAGPRYFVVVLGLIIMIFLHELGHYLTAKWTGMKVTQFFLFMGPRIWSFRRGEVEYGVRSLPVGAFVRIVGMHNLDPPAPEDADRAYMNKSYPKRMLVITAGSIMHFIQALLLFAVITSVVGLNDPARWSIAEISRLETGETPAVEAGLAPGDTISAIDGVTGLDWGELREYIRERPDTEVALTVVGPDGSSEVRTTTLAAIPDLNDAGEVIEVGFLGVGPSFEKTRQSPLMAVEMFGEVFWGALSYVPILFNPDTYLNLAELMASGSAEVDILDEEAERPMSMVGAVRIAGAPDTDITWPLTMLAALNIFVGLLNLVPLLPLDGGHAAIATYETIRSRIQGRRHYADVAKLMPLTYAVVLVLGFIFISTVWLDIFRPITS